MMEDAEGEGWKVEGRTRDRSVEVEGRAWEWMRRVESLARE